MGALPARLRIAFERGGEMGRRMSGLDWSTSPAGDPSTWQPELVGAVITMLASRTQGIIFWGPEYAALYNDGYIPIPGAKHPAYLGRPGAELWAEAWDQIRGLFQRVAETDTSFHADDHLFLLERHGFLEETYFDISYDPIRAEDGSISGIFCIVAETTGRVLGERRARTLSALGRRLSDLSDPAALADEAAAVLGENANDVPYAAVVLEGQGTHPAVRAVIASGRSGRAPLAELTESAPPAAEQALVLPIGVGADTVGALVVGVSRNLRLAGGYHDFLDLAAAQISRAVANARAYEVQRRRAAELAALDQAKTDFFSNVSHEFRTPLTLILGPLEDLIEAPDTGPALHDRLLPVHRNGLRLLKLVNTVLDFSRLESGRMLAVYRPTDLAGDTASLAASFRPAVERAGLDLVIEMPPSPVRVHVDHELWEKIVFNLLSNAVRSPGRGPRSGPPG